MKEEIEIQDVNCGKAKITRTFDDENVLVRQDVEIIVDPDKVPSLRGIAGALNGDNPSNLR